MTFQAKVIYDFDAVGEGELTVRAGDIVTVTNTSNVGEGWLFGVGVDGREGIVPEGYVERIPDAMYAPLGRQQSKNDMWDDDWDSDDEDKQDEVSNTPTPVRKFSPDSEPSTGSRPSSNGASTPSFSVTKFSHPFGKSDKVCDYLIGVTETSATVGKEAIYVTETSNGYFQWDIQGEPFSCLIGTPKKSTKFGGMKSFIAYQVTPSFSNIQVSRRYKHFDWLHERLVKKFGMITAIPPLPEKQVIGRFEEDLIEHRRVQLQSFADRICRHPVLSTSEVWKHFLAETDDKKWTQGKRKIEGDQNIGISLLTTIQAPPINKVTEKEIDDKIVAFSKDMGKMESALKNMKSIANDQIHRYRSVHTKEYKEIGKAFAQLGSSMPEEAPCLINIGACYQEMSDMWDKQVAKDWDPLQRMMHDYKGTTGGWDSVLGLYGNMKEKQKEIMKTDGWEKEKFSAEARVNTHRITVEAERTFFKQELGLDMTQISQMFLVEQINFQRQIADRLEKLYYECWPGAAGEEQFRRTSQTTLQADNDQGLTEWD